MWIDEIAEYLESKGVTDIPEPVYVETMAPDAQRAVMLAGPPSGMRYDPELPGFHKGGLQMVCRAKTSKAAEELAQLVSDTLETEVATNVTKLRINYIRPRHLPQVFPRSGGDYYEAVVNFDLCFVRLMA